MTLILAIQDKTLNDVFTVKEQKGNSVARTLINL